MFNAILALSLLLCMHASAWGRATRVDPADLGIDLSLQDGCDPLVPEACLLPFPNDYFTVRDRTTSTRRRIHFIAESLPANEDGTHIDPTDLNRNDGFSPGAAVLTWAPGVDLGRSGAPPITDIGRSLAADSPLVIVDATTRTRWPFWAELDLNSPPEESALILRPAVNFTEGDRKSVV